MAEEWMFESSKSLWVVVCAVARERSLAEPAHSPTISATLRPFFPANQLTSVHLKIRWTTTACQSTHFRLHRESLGRSIPDLAMFSSINYVREVDPPFVSLKQIR